jgi:hypothetical protein
LWLVPLRKASFTLAVEAEDEMDHLVGVALFRYALKSRHSKVREGKMMG